MKILLISGHGAGDPGAGGCGYWEAEQTRVFVNKLAPLLRECGAEVTVYDQNRNAYADAQRGALRPGKHDYCFEVHFNAGGGQGTEIWVPWNEPGVQVEEKIIARLGKILKPRGIKRADFSVIETLRRQGIPSALLETCFIDSAADMHIWKTRQDEIVKAVADGIADGFGLKKEPIKPGWEQHGSEWKYRFEDGSYKTNGWLCLEDGDYLFDEKGWMLRGWQKANGNWFYLDKSGRCIKNCVRTIKDGNSSDDTYAFDARGHMLTNTWVGENFFGETGRYLPNYGKKICSTCGQELK